MLFSDGVIGALARRQAPTGWNVEAGCAWRKLSVFKTGGGLDVDVKRFKIARQQARENDCDVLVYARDVDGAEQRKKLLVETHDPAANEFCLAVVDPCVEGWVLELRGDRKKGGWSKTGAQEAIGKLSTTEMEEFVADWDGTTEHLSDDLKRWLDDVKRVLSPAP